MSLLIQFQEDLLQALKKYMNFYVNKGISMPPDREREVIKLNKLLREENNILALRKTFIEHYHTMAVPGIVKFFPIFDTCLLRKNLKAVLFNKKYSEKTLKNAYLNELINNHSDKSAEKQALLTKIQTLENQLLEMRKQNHKLNLERSYLLNINQKLKLQNSKLKEILKNHNISLDEYDLEEFSENDRNSSTNESNNDNHPSERMTFNQAESGDPINIQSESVAKMDKQTLRKELSEAQKQIIEMKKQIQLLAESKEKMLSSNLKELQKEIKALNEAEEVIQKMEIQYSINNNTNVKQAKSDEQPIQEPKNPSLPYYFPRTFTR